MPPPLLNPASLPVNIVEDIERITTQEVFDGLRAYSEAYKGLRRSPRDMATDILVNQATSVALNQGGFSQNYNPEGTHSYYCCTRMKYLPKHTIPQMVLVASVAEKTATSIRLQLSQTTMPVVGRRKGHRVRYNGRFPKTFFRNGMEHLVTTIFVHYLYRQKRKTDLRILRGVTIATVPSGLLDGTIGYPNVHTDNIWGSIPAAGYERARARIHMAKLATRYSWRLQRLCVSNQQLVGSWIP